MKPESAMGLLRAAGLRATRPRIQVLCAVAAQATPVSHSQLLQSLPSGSLDGATVYRNLTRLAERGILRVVSRAGGMARYELATDAGHVHAHFVCTECDTISCLPEQAVKPLSIEGPWQASLVHASVQLRGRCPDCIAPPPQGR